MTESRITPDLVERWRRLAAGYLTMFQHANGLPLRLPPELLQPPRTASR